ncbi:ATP-dependent RNA helicase ddx18 [Saguinus oedipus]|uniref:ATP-dependent RNA helicase n=1 Tax=Saguinus oedipus TaxID=9490 RepID=A0ABQ9TER3_SAGOE|nr:ATP-dependent RNA helicase ddx18 [Saguinus oedipus]
MGGRKVKKSKHSMNVGFSEAQNGAVSQEAVENIKVKKSPQKFIVLTNGEGAMQSPNSVSKKKKKKKKRKMVNDAGPDTKKAKTGNKGESEDESAETPKETEINVEKPDNDEDDSEVPSLPLGLTGAFEDTSFASLCNLVNENTLKAIKEMGFTNMTEIQYKSIRPLLEGRDLLAATKTGSGKTLAFLIPAVELIVKLKFMPRNGTGVLILSTTRELGMQTFGVLKELMTHHVHTYGLIMGGSNRSAEAQKLANGINIIVATPGRLLDHMQNTPWFSIRTCSVWLLMKLIVSWIQTVLFSATQTQKVEDLARISLKKEPLYVGVDDNKANATVDGLEQGDVVCPSEKRFLLLVTFLKKNRKKKLMVFFSSCMSLKYHYELLNYIDLPVLAIHGKQKQNKHTTTFFQFCNADSGTLLCTDVAARGLDIPEVNWIVQCDPPDDPKEYIHRVALSFGFKVPPFVDLNVNSNEGKQKKRGGGGGFGYQKTKKVEKSKIFKHISKKSSDSRQFSH